jgi:hypothetical protein
MAAHLRTSSFEARSVLCYWENQELVASTGDPGWRLKIAHPAMTPSVACGEKVTVG